MEGTARGWRPAVLYAALAALGALVAQLHHGSVFTPPPGPRFATQPQTALAVGLALALVLAVVTLASTRWLVARTRWASALARALRGMVVGMSGRELRVLSAG